MVAQFFRLIEVDYCEMKELPTDYEVVYNDEGVFIRLFYVVETFLKGLLSYEVPVLSPIVPPRLELLELLLS